jgi:hypothetical protein
MPAKKAKDAKVSQISTVEIPPIPEHLLVRHPERWVQVHFKLLTSSLLDDVIRLPQTANLLMVESKIIAHHGGGISKLMFWKDDIQPKNILRDFSLSLADVWKLDDALPHTIHHPNAASGSGASAGQRYGSYGDPEDHMVVLCYDYKAHDSDCPLLLRSPRYTIQGFQGGTTTAAAGGAARGAASPANDQSVTSNAASMRK